MKFWRALSGGKTTHQETLQTSPDAILNCMTTIIINRNCSVRRIVVRRPKPLPRVKASPHDDDKPILLPGEWK
ncbi:hypothetical protein DMI62_19385 [Escherichia coli]|nr:hypothetical protein [Escherichia coli]